MLFLIHPAAKPAFKSNVKLTKKQLLGNIATIGEGYIVTKCGQTLHYCTVNKTWNSHSVI